MRERKTYTFPFVRLFRLFVCMLAVGIRNWRVSTWLGRGYVARFQKAYLAAVEEPFDSNDNTARSLGIRERNENTLPYVAWVFGHSVHLLRNVKTVEDGARVLTWLFGPDALPCVGLQRLKPSGIAKVSLRRLEKMAGGGCNRNGEEGEAEEEEADVRMVEFKKRLAFRALLDAIRMGSPIMTLDDWRLHHATRGGRPPFEWHKLAPLTPPLASPTQPLLLTSPVPPRMNANPQSPYSGPLGAESGAAARSLHQSISPEIWRMGGGADRDAGVARDPRFRAEERRWRSLAEDLETLLPRPQGLQRGQLGGVHPQSQLQQQEQQQQQQQQQQHELASRAPGFFSPAEAINGFGAPNGSGFSINGQDNVRLAGTNGFGASSGVAGSFGGGGGGAGAIGGFGGFMNPALRGATATPEPLVPTQRQSLDQLLMPPLSQQQHEQQQQQQQQQDALRQSLQQLYMPPQQQQQLGPGPRFNGSGLLEGLPQPPGERAMAGQTILDALRTGSAERAVVAAANARDAVAKVGLGGMAPAASGGAGDAATAFNTATSTSTSTSRFGGAAQNSDRPVSAFSFYSGIQLQAPQAHQVSKQQQQQQQQQQQVPGGYPSLSSSLFSLAMSTSGNSQLLQWDSSQSVPQPQLQEQQQQHQLTHQDQLKQQNQQNNFELQELLRLLSVYPGNQPSNLPQPQPQSHQQQHLLPAFGSPAQSAQPAQLSQLSQPPQPLAIASAAGGVPQAGQNPQTRMLDPGSLFQSSAASSELGAHMPGSAHYRPTHHTGASSYDPVVAPTGLAVQSSSYKPQYYGPQSPQPAQQQQQQSSSVAGLGGFGLPYPFSSIFNGTAAGAQGGGDAGNSASSIAASMSGATFGPIHSQYTHEGQQQQQCGFGAPGAGPPGLLSGQAGMQPPPPLSSSVPTSYSIFGRHQPPQLQPQAQRYDSNAFASYDPKQYPGELGEGGPPTRTGVTSTSLSIPTSTSTSMMTMTNFTAPVQHNFGSIGPTYPLSATASGSSNGNAKSSPRVSSDGSTRQTTASTSNGNSSSRPVRANGGHTLGAAVAPKRPPGF
ncbi:hypothetical protein Vretimale_98 [Volvox reticuliferus]|uniref:Uncharacterized protein n=1 Tax=Volvox reticuliferus TaxID=1737510 RepID=A0A8J4FWY5_9CHLO|nr:hypothetical protein Vretimale_98 [Volvox reticuliferus]